MKDIKVLTIGSATMDVFVECDEANVVSVCQKNDSFELMSYPYGSKIDITDFSSNVGGGGINTACNLAHLGFNTSAIFKIGDDIYANGIETFFKDKKVNLDNIIQDKSVSTGFSIILVSFQGDRTVLAHRGANAQIKFEEINLDVVKNADFIYIAPLNGCSNEVLEPLVKYAHENNTVICVNAGTTSLKKGFNELKNILGMTDVIVLNKEEATLLTDIHVRPDTKTEKFSKDLIHTDIKKMLDALAMDGDKVVVITDGNKGAYSYFEGKYYYCPIFPSNVVSTLGAGDAFASTFCASYSRTHDIGKCLMYASVNSSSVVSKFSATEGLLTFDEIEAILNANQEFTYQLG